MPTYILELPEEGETKALLINLVGTLEKLYATRGGMRVYDAICVQVTAGHPVQDALRDLAREVIPEYPTFDQPALVDLSGTERRGDETITITTQPPTVSDRYVRPETVINTDEFLKPEPGIVPISATSSYRRVTKKERTCPQCGERYLPQGNRQLFCSKACRVAAGANGSPPPAKNGGHSDGSGVKRGKLVSG